jgi:hypothetical protein
MRKLATMQQVRRLAPVAVLALVAALVLTGCRSRPEVAAYIGDMRVTVAELDAIVDEATRERVSADRVGDVRSIALSSMIFLEAAKRLVAERKLPAPTVNPQATADSLQLPVGLRLVQISAESDAYRDLILKQPTEEQPTDADLRSIYEQANVPNIDFEAAKPQIAQIPEVPPTLAAKRALTRVLSELSISVNPRYGGNLQITLLELQAGGEAFKAVVLPITGRPGGSPVRARP